MAGAAEVAARGEGVAVFEGQVGPGGAEDVPTAVQDEPGAGHDLDLAADLDGVEEPDGGVDIGLVVERFGGPVRRGWTMRRTAGRSGPRGQGRR